MSVPTTGPLTWNQYVTWLLELDTKKGNKELRTPILHKALGILLVHTYRANSTYWKTRLYGAQTEMDNLCIYTDELIARKAHASICAMVARYGNNKSSYHLQLQLEDPKYVKCIYVKQQEEGKPDEAVLFDSDDEEDAETENSSKN